MESHLCDVHLTLAARIRAKKMTRRTNYTDDNNFPFRISRRLDCYHFISSSTMPRLAIQPQLSRRVLSLAVQRTKKTPPLTTKTTLMRTSEQKLLRIIRSNKYFVVHKSRTTLKSRVVCWKQNELANASAANQLGWHLTHFHSGVSFHDVEGRS